MTIKSIRTGWTGISMQAGNSPFSPLDIPGLQAWYDASDLGTISVSANAVTQWSDKSGNANDLTQGTAANRPSSGLSTQNGLNVITFDGGDGLINSTKANWKFLSDGTKYLVAFVAKTSTTSNPNAYYVYMSTSYGSVDTGTWMVYDDVASQSRNDALDHAITRSASGTFNTRNLPNNVLSNPQQYEAIGLLADPSNGTASDRSYWTVENTTTGVNSDTNAVNNANPTRDFVLGNWYLYNFGITGGFAELVIVSGSSATSTNRDRLMTYLKNKWGV